MAGSVQPIRLRPRGDAPPPRAFHRGAHAPYATRWFGATSLAGHARNLVASAIAAESIDSRDWMRPEQAERLLSQVERSRNNKDLLWHLMVARRNEEVNKKRRG